MSKALKLFGALGRLTRPLDYPQEVVNRLIDTYHSTQIIDPTNSLGVVSDASDAIQGDDFTQSMARTINEVQNA